MRDMFLAQDILAVWQQSAASYGSRRFAVNANTRIF